MISVAILAAGFGTRMKSATPKVLHKVCGKPMLFYVIDAALTLSSDVKVILFNQKELIIEKITQHYPACLLDKISFITQNHEKYPGTGGALMSEDKKLVGFKYENILILNGDTPLISSQELEELCSFGKDSDILVGAIKSSNPHGYGRIILESKNTDYKQKVDSNTFKSKHKCDGLDTKYLNLARIVEQKDATQEELQIDIVNSGIYFCKKEILSKNIQKLDNLNAQSEYYLTDIIKHSEGTKKIFLLNEDRYKGVNSKVELSEVENIMLDALRRESMRNGVIMHLPHTIYIESSVKFIGECEIGAGVSIYGNSIIENAHIKASSCVIDSKIVDSDVGPSAHIRPQCEIIKSHIGNFVECKNARLNSVKAGHLSYLGDCEIDSGTNIGAGVIICNYDGKKKHKTVIGKNVFIGSDTQLIAPLNIEDNSIIAAGSSITKDVKSGQMVITRASDKVIENGYFRFFKKD